MTNFTKILIQEVDCSMWTGGRTDLMMDMMKLQSRFTDFKQTKNKQIILKKC
jgi:hypothetical protein